AGGCITEIEEILADIFRRFAPKVLHGELQAVPGLAALVRTCRTFKEPALVLLWRGLMDSSPLARCLPDACPQAKCRSLTQTEWDAFQS
ncbi:hypothetical protein V8E55_000353, partial [Tylopilus felleus]